MTLSRRGFLGLAARMAAGAVLASATIYQPVVLKKLLAPTPAYHIGDFQKFAFPLIRQVYPNLHANQILGVQPMLQNSPLVYLDLYPPSRRGWLTALRGRIERWWKAA